MSSQELFVGSRLARGRWLVVALLVVAVLGQIAIGALGGAFGSVSADELWVFFVALVVAAVLTLPTLAAVLWIDRRERESPWLYAFALAWGMIGAAGLSLLLNSAAMQSVYESLADAATGPASSEVVADEAFFLVAVFVGPFVEEVAKGIALLLLAFFLRGQFFTVRDGIVFGILVGLGFNLLEAPWYVMAGVAETGSAPWAPQLAARFVFFGLNGHALFTALFGAGVGYAIQRGGSRGILGGIAGALAAIVAHMLNNGLLGIALWLVLAALGFVPAEGADGAGFLLSIPLPAYWASVAIATIALQWWSYLALGILLLRSGRYERTAIREQLALEVGRSITLDEYDGIATEPRFGLRRIPGLSKRASRDLVTAQNKLALGRARAVHLGLDPEADPQVALWRTEIARLRAGTLVARTAGHG